MVVAAIGPELCSRPFPLKSFLYLDFIDVKKRAAVQCKLMDAIGKEDLELYSEPHKESRELSFRPSVPYFQN